MFSLGLLPDVYPRALDSNQETKVIKYKMRNNINRASVSRLSAPYPVSKTSPSNTSFVLELISIYS